MGRHLSQSTVTNPMDANRKYITQLVESMGELVIAIAVAPENFSVADINILKTAADAFAKNLEELGRTNQVTHHNVNA